MLCEKGLVLKGKKNKMRPVFAGNLEYDTRQSELERLFSKYGRIDRVDMKSGKNSCVSLLIYANIVYQTCCTLECCYVEPSK